jgi:hypothetical protein
MSDSVNQLRESPALGRLLEHYAQVPTGDATAWQDRLGEMEGVTRKDLVQLHGELLAQAWVEQNTGVVVLGKLGVVAACYRITAAGRRALRLLALPDPDEEMEESIQPERAA